MRNFKKFLTFVLVVMMIVSSLAFTTSAATTKFEDIDAKNEELVKAVDLLNYMGVAKGTSETTFGASEAVTRQQFALFIYRLMKGGKDAPAGAANSTAFTDLEDATYNYAIAWANAQGIVNGKSATTFAPKDGIKLQEAYAMIVRALGWEEEKALVYPFGHIEVAEQDGVELDNGLASSVGYTDTLTRGDMAILLYNAFFAETGKEEVYTVERKIGGDDDAATWVLQEYTTNPRLCEKAFDVIEVEYKAVGTPNYYTGDAEATYDLGYDAIYFEKVEGSEVNAKATAAPQAAYLTPEQIGVAAEELNNYFLGEFTMFVTVDDEEIEKVLFADCNMTKKTVTDLKLGEVSSNKAASYFADTEAKLLSGKIVANGTEDIYVYNAPYSYASPVYGLDSDADEKYALRNEKNIQSIEFGMVTENETNIYSVEIAPILDSAYDETGFYATEAGALVEAFEQVYYGGLYEADLYDVDGDGLYDYINYKPYRVFQVDGDEEYFFDESDFTGDDNDAFGIPYIYTQEATVIGEYADEDVVIGFFDEALKIVKIAAVVKPTVDTIASFKKADGTLTLASGAKVDAAAAWGLLANNVALLDEVVFDADAKRAEVVAESELFTLAALDEEETMEFYVYDGKLLLTSEVNTVAKFTENLIIPTEIKPVKEAPFNPDADNEVYYVYAWVDGTMKYVQVELNDDNTPWVTDGANVATEYLNKLCTYTVKDNIYTIYPLSTNVVDEDDDVVSEALAAVDSGVLAETEKEDQVYTAELGTTITKVAGSRFDIGADFDVDFKSYTKIIIRVEDEEGDFEYVEYDAASFKKSLDEDVELDNMQAVVANNPDSVKRENLVLLYAETTDLAFAGKADKNGYRIVSGYDLGEDKDGKWRYFYELYDPYTGAKVKDVPSVAADVKANRLGDAVATGTIVELIEGQVDEDEIVATIDTSSLAAANLVWIAEVDEAEGFFTVVPYDASLIEDVDVYVEYCEDPVNDIYGNVLEVGNFIDYDKNTVVSVIARSAFNNDFFVDASIKLSDMSAIAKAGKDVLAYNTKAEDRNGNYVTKYADYVKAFISVDADKYDAEEGTNAVAEFIIVVVNDGEPSALDDAR